MTVFEAIRQMLVEELAVKPEMVKPEAKIREDLGADSIDAQQLVIELEEHFEIEIGEDEAQKVISVSDVVELVDRKLQAKNTRKA